MANHTVSFQHHQRILDNMAESLSMFHELLKQPGMKGLCRFYQRKYTPGERVSGLELLGVK